MLTISVATQKGGAGKTATVANFAGVLAEAGARVLVVDFDSQTQLAPAVGAQDLLEYGPQGELVSFTVADLIRPPARGPAPTLRDTIIHTRFPGLDLLPGSPALDELRGSLESSPSGRSELRRVLGESAFSAAGLVYDWVLIDTAPKLDIFMDNALVASDFVVAVLAPEMQQAEPLTRFVGRVGAVKESLRPELELLGVLFNKANYNWAATDKIPAMLSAMGLPVLETVIPMYSRIANSYGFGPVALTAPNSREAAVLRTAAQEIVDAALKAAGAGVPA